MGTEVILIGLALAIILAITATFILAHSNGKTPEDRYRRGILAIPLSNPKNRADRWARNDWAPPTTPGGGVG